MNNMFTTFLLRGGTEEEHLTGNGAGFIGAEREVTVDTTKYTLRVHDGKTIGGVPLVTVNDNINAQSIVFEDGETLQEKLDNGSLGGGSGNPDPIPPSNTKPIILAIDVKDKLQNGTANIIYYIQDKEQTEFTHKLSINNGKSFVDIVPLGDNPYEYMVEGLSLGQNLCAIRVSDGSLEDTKYFIVDIPNVNIDTAPVISEVTVSEISSTGFKVKYKVYDKENDDIQRHRVSLDNGFSYTDIYPMLIDGYYETNITGLTAGKEYFARLKVVANNLESLTYGFTVTTSNTSTVSNPYLKSSNGDLFSLSIENSKLTLNKVVDDLNINSYDNLLIKNSDGSYSKVKVVDNNLIVE